MIFIHSSFRTCSTYVWALLRKNPNVIAYYEIFNEANNTMTLADIPRVTPTSWQSRHPDGAPYFLEFAPLMREAGGVEGFLPSFSYERFIPPDGPSGAVSEEEASYIQRLIDHAESRSKIPVLTATRSLGRVAGLKACAPGLHVVLYRSILQQWCSYTEQAVRGSPYFLNTVTNVFEHNEHDQILGEIKKLFPVQDVSSKDINLFRQFYFLHLYVYAHAASSADLILDINRAAVDEKYRADLEGEFAAWNVSVDFSDIAENIGFSLLDVPAIGPFLESLRVFGDVICDRVGTEAGIQFGKKIFSDLERELQTYEFYAKPLRSFYGGLEDKHDAIRTEAAQLRVEHADALAQRDGALAQRDAALEAALREQERLLAAERMIAERASAEVALVRQEHATLRAERDAALAVRDEAAASRDDAQLKFAKLLNWSVAYHDSTASSLGWKMTRPLRWVGIGRPRRPEKPDFFE